MTMTNKSIRDYINLIEDAQREGVAEGSEELYQQAIRKYVQRVANNYLGGGNAHLYGAGNFDSEMFGVDPKQAEQDFDKLFPQYVKQLQDKQQGVAEGSLNEFAPDGFNGGDDGDGFDPDIAKMAQDDGFTKGVSLADGATLERAMAINHWHSTHGGMYKQYFAKGFKEGRLNKIKHDNRQYNLNLKLMKDGSIRHGEQGVVEEQLEETSPEAIAKINQITRK